MDFGIEDPISLVDPNKGIKLVDESIVIDGAPMDSDVGQEMQDDIKDFCIEMHHKYRGRVRNLGIRRVPNG